MNSFCQQTNYGVYTESHKIFPKFLTGAATSIHSAIYRWFAPQSPVKILGQGEKTGNSWVDSLTGNSWVDMDDGCLRRRGRFRFWGRQGRCCASATNVAGMA